MNILEVTLGILTAIGGFIDIGELVFNTQAGALFGYNLIWAVPVSAIIITLYAEMCGRVAIVTKKPVFELIREKLGFSLGLCTLISANVLNILTCAAEIGGVAYVLRLLFGTSYEVMIVVAFLFLMANVWIASFKVLEKMYGLLGLLMVIFVAALFSNQPNWQQIATNFIPHVPHLSTSKDYLLYAYYAVGIIAAGIMPYEVFFYSSGQIEEKKTPKDLSVNALTAILGFGFGSVLSITFIVLAAKLFMPHGISPQLVGTAALTLSLTYGKLALFIGLLGMFFTIGGAAVETCFAGAYNFTQFFGWAWGKEKKPQTVPHFTTSWMIIFALALMVLTTGVDPIRLTEYAVIFSVLVLPFTYFSILVVAGDKKYMGEYANSSILTILGWIFFVVILIIALSAVPLMYLTHGGQG